MHNNNGSFQARSGGFDFDLTRRNDVALGKMKLQLPKYQREPHWPEVRSSLSSKIENVDFDVFSRTLSLHLSLSQIYFIVCVLSLF